MRSQKMVFAKVRENQDSISCSDCFLFMFRLMFLELEIRVRSESRDSIKRGEKGAASNYLSRSCDFSFVKSQDNRIGKSMPSLRE